MPEYEALGRGGGVLKGPLSAWSQEFKTSKGEEWGLESGDQVLKEPVPRPPGL